MVKGKLTNGFEFEVDEEILLDYDFLKLSVEYGKDSSNLKVFDDMLLMIFGEEQKAAFEESFRNKNGRKLIKPLMEGFRELTEILTEKNKEIKN